VLVGDRVVIGEGVSIGANVSIGDDTVIWPGTVIGNDGFQFERLDGKLIKIAHVGGVSIGREVEIKSNCCIDRHIFRDHTRIGDQTKFDNLVYVGHCTQIGRACLLGAHAAITGSVVIGDEVWIGPNATISSTITVGSQAAVSLGSVVTRDVPPGQRVSGNFAIKHDRFLSFIRSVR
jgi:UDP-3-O-[3-hydroxymyristoyl] glucosamine N-acyltransferase